MVGIFSHVLFTKGAIDPARFRGKVVIVIDILFATSTLAHPQASVLPLCAGSLGRFNLEASYGAGHLAAHLVAQRNYSCTDVALAALYVRRGREALDVLAESSIGRKMCARGLSDEVEFAARVDTLSVVPVLGEGQRIWSVA
ncbi:MAG TPA: 2-phosphosulfolactate phosphatase [Steroidobacteraceae bacterium]|nr:2-phosphosulfolactate phosphatase [Steroidobacteraceae bacterium]